MRRFITIVLLLGLLLPTTGLAEAQSPAPSDFDVAYSTWNSRFALKQEKYGYGMALFFYNLLSPASVHPPKLLDFTDLSEGNKKHSILTFERFTYEVVRDRGLTMSVSFTDKSEQPNIDWAKALMFSYVPSFTNIEGISESFMSSVLLSPRDTVYSHVYSKYLWLNYTITKQSESFTHRIDVISLL